MRDTGKTILIVDDSALIVERLIELLEKEKTVASIDVARSYEHAIQLLAEKIRDVVILDIHLPGKNGIDLLKYIAPTYPEVKVVMLSNESNQHYRKLCITNGASFFIDKSKEFEQIPQILTSLND